MNGVFAATRIMKASQVRKQYVETRNETSGSYLKGGKLSEEW
ncbi:hypothetical protein [Bacillus sp. FSL R9-9410]